MGAGHSEAWDDIRGVSQRTLPLNTPKERTQNRMGEIDSLVIDMLEVITSMKIDSLLKDEKRQTKEQLFFQEIRGIVDHLGSIGELMQDKVGLIRNIGKVLGINRTLLDGYFLYSKLRQNGNEEYRKNISKQLSSLRGKSVEELKTYWNNKKAMYKPSIITFENFEKVLKFYFHQN